MIRIMARKALRFTNPHYNALSKPSKNETAEESAKRIINDQQRMFHTAQRKEMTNMYFNAPPNEIVDAPDWIKEDDLFHWAVKDGDVVELKSKAETVAGSLAAAAEAKGEEVVGNVRTGTKDVPVIPPTDLADEEEETEEGEESEEEDPNQNPDGNMANTVDASKEPGGPSQRRQVVGKKSKKKGPSQQ